MIPTYNTGNKVYEVVRAVAATGFSTLVVADGCNDGTAEGLRALCASLDNTEFVAHEQNCGKGQAILTACHLAKTHGFTHILAFDADGQHPANAIKGYADLSRQFPNAMVAGYPVFDAAAPWERVLCRKLANVWTRFLSVNPDLRDSMFGMRVYPLEPLLRVFAATKLGRHYDLECVAAIRLSWDGHPVKNIATPVQYFQKSEGGVSHYRYMRDNIRLGRVYLRLIPGALQRWLRKFVS